MTRELDGPPAWPGVVLIICGVLLIVLTFWASFGSSNFVAVEDVRFYQVAADLGLALAL